MKQEKCGDCVYHEIQEERGVPLHHRKQYCNAEPVKVNRNTEDAACRHFVRKGQMDVYKKIFGIY